MNSTSTQTQSVTEICGYQIERVAAPGQTYVALGPGGRRVVLKKLDADCLLGKGLHPSIGERLSRVRELAHAGVANFHGVVRDGNGDFLVWEYVPGLPVDQYVGGRDCTGRELLVLAREIILHVDSLHMQGIVHGAVSGGNVIIGEGPSVRLTHISPLLYTDASTDVEAVVTLLRQTVRRRDEMGSSLGVLLTRTSERSMSLRTLGAQVAVLVESGKLPEAQTPSPRKSIRRRTVVEAILVAALGVLLGYGVWRAFDSGGDLRHAFRWIPGSSAGK